MSVCLYIIVKLNLHTAHFLNRGLQCVDSGSHKEGKSTYAFLLMLRKLIHGMEEWAMMQNMGNGY